MDIDDSTPDDAERRRLRRLAGPVHLRLTRRARRSALLAGLAAGPFASAGAGLTAIGVSAAAGSIGAGAPWFASTTVFLLLGLASLAVAILIGRRATRGHHRRGAVALGGLALTGLPFIPAAPGIAASVILALAVTDGTVQAAPPALVYATCWAALAAIGLVVGPLAFWLVAHLNRTLPRDREGDAEVVGRFEATSEPVD